MAKHLHEKLGITFQQYVALLGVRELLARGDVTQGEYYSRAAMDRVENGAHLFNMSHSGTIVGCGTIGCIGGYMGFVMGRTSMPSVGQGHPLYALFYPDTRWEKADHNWTWITPKVAVKAIDNWLKNGNPGWNKLVPATYRKDY